MPPDDQLLQYEVGLMKVEDEVKLAHVAKVAVQDLHELVDDIQHYQLVVILFHACREIETRISVTWYDDFAMCTYLLKTIL